MFFKKVAEPTSLEILYMDMKEAMINYTKSLHVYQSYLKDDEDSASAQASLLFHQMEVYREQYYKLRVEYEALHGDLSSYSLKLQNFFAWTKEAKVRCLIQKPHDTYIMKSVLARL